MSDMMSSDVGTFLDQLSTLADKKPSSELAACASTLTFDVHRPLFVSRAPGRLDVMGGIADYSGSLVLQMPIAEATIVAIQLFPTPADSSASRLIRAASVGGAAAKRAPSFEMPLQKLFSCADGGPTPLAELQAFFAAQADAQWAAYVVGVLGVLAHEPETRRALAACGGCSVLVSSAVPEGKGVSSSAAVEVATMMAALGALGVTMQPSERVATLCQRVENFVVGAPCGIMDQMASSLGHESKLLPLLCQPAIVEPPVAIPSHLRFWGIDSGVAHSVGGCDYGTVRTATFMAKTVLRAELASRAQAAAAGGEASGKCQVLPAQVTALEYLVALSPSLLAELAPCLPAAIRGADFSAKYGSHGDAATNVEAETVYDLRGCAAHPVHEHFRVRTFRQLLSHTPSDEQLEGLGELMYQSHASYSAIGLGSSATDSIVQLVRSLGPASGLYGAKITGGGSGGTVCVLGAATAEAEASFQKVLAAYSALSGHTPYVVAGSSLGAIEFGHVEVADVRDGARALAADGGASSNARAGKGKKRQHD